MSLWKWCWLGMFTMTDSSVNHRTLSQTTDDNFTINLFFRFDIVNISRSQNRLAKAVSNLYQTLDNGLEFLHILDLLFSNQGRIDSRWHDLDKVIILGHLNRRIHTLRNDHVKTSPSEQAEPKIKPSRWASRTVLGIRGTPSKYLVLDKETSLKIFFRPT